MNEHKRTFQEIIDHPETITADEKKDIEELYNALEKLMKISEGYKNIKQSMKNTENILSERFYQEHFIMSAILEAFSFQNKISFKQLNEYIINYVPQEFMWDISVARINSIISKMIRLRLIEPIRTENEYTPDFIITNEGLKAFQEHTFQTLATSSFFSYHTYKLNKQANQMSKSMLLVTISSVIVTILSIIVTIIVSFK